ncbi:hypothetical protein MNBD_ALPHA05-853 [hydrothermal vent metagenome]|uniref:Uncharacterized protein n=1 Tax=hydrothermal vent metagenome TaxID=652676 RepID=A0A3B0RHU5_9ZZZZ
MSELSASLLQRAWRKVDVKLSIDGDMHILRWRRGWFVDEVLFDDRRVATSSGIVNRETIFGLGIETSAKTEVRLVFMIDTAEAWNDWSGEWKPRGVRLETADTALIAYGSLGPDRAEPFRQLFDRAVRAIGL